MRAPWEIILIHSNSGVYFEHRDWMWGKICTCRSWYHTSYVIHSDILLKYNLFTLQHLRIMNRACFSFFHTSLLRSTCNTEWLYIFQAGILRQIIALNRLFWVLVQPSLCQEWSKHWFLSSKVATTKNHWPTVYLCRSCQSYNNHNKIKSGQILYSIRLSVVSVSTWFHSLHSFREGLCSVKVWMTVCVVSFVLCKCGLIRWFAEAIRSDQMWSEMVRSGRMWSEVMRSGQKW